MTAAYRKAVLVCRNKQRVGVKQNFAGAEEVREQDLRIILIGPMQEVSRPNEAAKGGEKITA